MQIETTENHVEKTAPRKMNEEKMQQDLAYRFSEKISRGLLEKGLITEEEFTKLGELNKEFYSPCLKELIA